MIGDNEVVDYLIKKEGFLTKPTNIGDGKITLGSGLTDPKWVALYRQRGNKWSEQDNRRAVLEEVVKRRKWAAETIPNWNLLPEASQDSLLSYKYNYDFTPTNSPKLFKALEAKNFREAARQMDATSKDPKFQKGLLQRRKEEQEWFLSGFNSKPQSASPSQAAPRLTIPATNMQQNYVAQPDATRVYRPEYIPKVKNIPHTQHPVEKNFWGEWGRMPYKAEGGVLKTNHWNNLPMKDRSELIRIALQDGIYDLDTIRNTYNEYAEGGGIHIAPSKKGTFTAAATKHDMGVQEFASKVLAHPENYSPAMRKKANFARNASKWHGLGGNLYDLGGDTVGEWINTIYQNNPKEYYLGEPAHHYDFTQSEEWANAHGYYPDARGHRDDRVKKPAHPSHSSRGVWDGDKFVLSELGMQNPNYTLFGLNDGGQDPQATLIYKGGNVIPETTVTPSGNYIFNPYDNIKIKFANGGNLYDGVTEPTQQMNNSYSYTKPLSNVYVDSEGNVLDPDVPSARGTVQLPEVVVAAPDWKDVVGRYSIASNDATTISGLRPQNTHLKKQAEEGAAKHAAWAKENPGLETIGLIAGAAPFAVAATPAIVGGGELAYPILTNPYVDAGITSAFAGHGLNHAINEGIDGWGDAAMTALELTPLGRLAKPMYNAGIDAAASGRRFMLDVGDRYQGMKDAAAYRGANEIKDANMKWLESHGNPAGINRMGVNYDGSFGIYYPNNSKAGHWYSPVVEKGGEMTLTTHLGGDFPGKYSKDILPMSKSEIAATVKYLRGVPEHTYFGEVGKTKNYAEQYFNENPSRIKAFRDAIHGKKEINEPYWNEKEHITYFMNETDPIEQAYYRHQYEANEPLSVDSYKLILQEAAKDNGKFALRYDSSPMGMFNPQGVYGEEFYNSLQSLTPKEQVKAINDWMRSYYPKARPAYLKNGKVMIPRPLLMLRSSK